MRCRVLLSVLVSWSLFLSAVGSAGATQGSDVPGEGPWICPGASGVETSIAGMLTEVASGFAGGGDPTPAAWGRALIPPGYRVYLSGKLELRAAAAFPVTDGLGFFSRHPLGHVIDSIDVDFFGLTSPVPSDELIASASYDPWGNASTHNPHEPFPSEEGTGTPISFGYRSELHLGDQIHLRGRDYQPATATFTSPDPLDGADGTPVVANPYHYADNDPLNKTDPLGLRPEDCKFSENGCRYVVEDLATGYQGSGVGSTNIGGPVSGWQASDYRAESIAAGNEAGIDPRMVYAIFHRESKWPRGPLADQLLHECWLWGKCSYPSLGPTNFEVNAPQSTLASHPELWDAMSYLDPQEDSHNVGAFAFLMMDIGDPNHASIAARATAYRLADLNSALNGLIAKYRISTITLATFERKKSEEPDSFFFFFRSSLLGLGWFGGGEMRDGRTVEQGIYRMDQALSGGNPVKANVAGSPGQCYVNVYGESFTAASGALGLSGRATC